MKRVLSGTMTSERWKEFLDVPSGSRAARLAGLPLIPRPVGVSHANGVLTWTWYSGIGGPNKPPELQTAPAELCFEFARLAQGSVEEICCFAERWGPLNLERREEEKVQNWRYYARLALALLRFTAALKAEGRGEEEDWRLICQTTPARELDRKGMPKQWQLAIVAAAVNNWFNDAREHGILTMLNHDLQVRPHASALFGILVTQIAHVIARSDQKAVCAGCHEPFQPTRPLSRGVRQYCKRCRKRRVPARDAMRDLRQRAREKKVAAVRPSRNPRAGQ